MIRFLTDIAICLYLAVFYCFYLTHADMFLARSNIMQLAPTSSFVMGAAPLLFIITMKQFVSQSSRGSIAGVLLANKYIVFSFAIIVVSALFLSFHSGSDWSDGGKYIYLNVYSLFVFLTAMLLPLLSQCRRHIQKYMLLSLVVLILTIVWDLIFPGTFSKLEARAAGFARDPNMAVFLVVILCSVILKYDRIRILSTLVLVASGVAVFATLSRGGILLFGLLCFYYALSVFQKKNLKPSRILFTFLITVVCVFSAEKLLDYMVNHSDVFSTYSAKQRIAAYSGEQELFTDDDPRLEAVREGIALIMQSPVIGHGTGYSRSISDTPHNMYLRFWIENGLFGLIFYAALLLSCLHTFRKRNFSAGIIFSLIIILWSMFTHTLFENRTYLLVMGTLCSMSLGPKFFGDR